MIKYLQQHKVIDYIVSFHSLGEEHELPCKWFVDIELISKMFLEI